MRTPAQDTIDEPELVRLVARRQERWHRIDSRLPQVPSPWLVSLIHDAGRVSRNDPVVVGRPSDPDCMAFPYVRDLSEESDDLVYFDRVTGSAMQLTFRDLSPMTLGRSFGLLLSRLETIWSEGGATAGVLNWPTRDGDPAEYFRAAGYTLDSYLALRTGLGPQQSTLRSNLRAKTRLATPPDEKAILELHSQVIDAHVPNAPFARHHASAAVGMRSRLRRAWRGEALEKGGPLIMVADLDGKVVAMAECQFRSIKTHPDSLLRPGKYALINTFAVAKEVRRLGIGHILERAVSDAFVALSIDGFYLIYSPYNPSASAFWPSVGYEPLWTLYQKRGLTTHTLFMET